MVQSDETNKPSRGTIVCVDDERQILELLRAILETEGYEVFLLNDSRLAVEESLSLSPDLFILDFNMPHVNGIELSEQIKRLRRLNIFTSFIRQPKKPGTPMSLSLSKALTGNSFTLMPNTMAKLA